MSRQSNLPGTPTRPYHRRSRAIQAWLDLHGLTTKGIAFDLGVPRETVERWIIGLHHPSGLYRRAVIDRYGRDCPFV